MSKTITVELEDDEYRILERFAETFDLSIEGAASLAILGVNQSFITGVANPGVLEDLKSTEFGKAMGGRLDKVIERERSKGAD